MASFNNFVPLHFNFGKKINIYVLGNYFINIDFYFKYDWNFLSKFWNIEFGSYI